MIYFDGSRGSKIGLAKVQKNFQIPTLIYNVTINADQSRTLAAASYYGAGQLYVTVTKDENWTGSRAGTMEEYKDKEGHVVLKRVYNFKSAAAPVLSTYYVYDDLGNLAFVIPPAANGDAATVPSAAVLNNLCYQYRYDSRNRMSQKKLPGKGWEYTVYNIIDQPVATQDSLQRAAGQWIVTKYDAQARPVITGILASTATRATLQATVTALTTNLWEAPVNTGNGYTNVAWPTTGVTATLTTDFYDTYANIPGLPATYTLSSGVSTMTKGLPTVKKTAVLNTPANMLWDVMYYDDLGRNIKTYAQHYLGAALNTGNYDLVTTTYNFNNQPTTTSRQHWNTASATVPLVTIANQYLYDHIGRKLETWEQITNGTTPTTRTLLSKIDYNEIGQVLNKHLHSTDSSSFLQNIAYTYNERGWLLTSSAPLFAMQLYYNTGTNKQYNGNIAYQYWSTPNANNPANNYTYTYDKLNRLTSGISTDNNKEQNITYDPMGNITTLNRYQAGTLIDQLAYTYGSTNQLQSITDATTSDLGLKHGTFAFTYDGNGNLATDPSKGTTGISYAYNLLNLPQSITALNTTYTYDATGQKLRRVIGTAATDYINGIQYDGTTSETITFIQTEEGRALPNGASAYNYEYSLGDNLGNTRITFDTGTGVARTEQQDNYLPFGMDISVGTIGSPQNKYLYNKKELQDGLGTYDYGARFYDPVVGRWTSVDKYAEHPDQINLSPYAYVGNNPIDRTDPDGNCPPCDVPSDDLIQPTSDHYRHEHPVLAAIHDVAYAIVDFTGLKDVENSVGHLGDKNVPTKAKVDRVVQATVNVLSIGEEGEGEGFHKNSNDYVGHQSVYEIKIDGEVQKYGKADMTNTSKTTGEPRRMQTQLNKLQKEKPAANVQGKVTYEHKNVSTKEIKAIETLNIKEFAKKNGKTPPGNKNHPGT